MKTFVPSTGPHSRLEREIERERNQRLKNDDEKSGIRSDDDLRAKDARDNASSGLLQRSRPR